jgi:polysaccharide biosynthesis transport protein
MRNLPSIPQDNRLTPQHDSDYIRPPLTEDIQEKSFRDYINIIRRRKWLVVTPLFIILPFVTLLLFTQSPVYEAVARVQIENVNPNVISIEEVVSTERNADSPDFYRTQYEIIKSRAVIERVINALPLYQEMPAEEPKIRRIINEIIGFPRRLVDVVTDSITTLFSNLTSDEINNMESTETFFAIEGIDDLPAGVDYDPEKERREHAIKRLQNALDVEPTIGTQLVDIKLRGSDPVTITQQVNIVAEAYAKRNLEIKLDASKKAILWLTKKEEDLRKKIYENELALQGYKEQKSFLYSDQFRELRDPVINKINVLQNSYLETNIERKNLEKRILEIRRFSEKDIQDMLGALPDILNSSLINSLKNKYTELSIDYNNLSKTYRDNHPRVSRLVSEIHEMKTAIYKELNNLINSMKKDYDILLAKEKSVEKEIEEQDNILTQMSNDILKFNELKRELEIDKDLNLMVSKRLAETTLTAALETNNIKLIEKATVPIVPVPSGKMKKMMLSIIATLGLGVGLAMARDHLDTRFKSIDEVELYLGIPFLGFIPCHKVRRNKPIALYNPGAMASETYRTLRAWIRLPSQHPIKTLLVASAMPGEGKSYTAANLAISFAQLGQRVLLVDADLRRPSLQWHFMYPNNKGLVNVLADGTAWESVLQDTALENLKVLPTGGRPHNPAELLSTGRMQQLLKSVQSTFDMIIVDTPATLAIPDVVILIPEIDGVLLVHDPVQGDRDAVLEAGKILDRYGTNFIGIIFNNVSLKKQKLYFDFGKYQYITYEKLIKSRGSKDGTYVDMRPMENREKWILEAHNEHKTSNSDMQA